LQISLATCRLCCAKCVGREGNRNHTHTRKHAERRRQRNDHVEPGQQGWRLAVYHGQPKRRRALKCTTIQPKQHRRLGGWAQKVSVCGQQTHVEATAHIPHPGCGLGSSFRRRRRGQRQEANVMQKECVRQPEDVREVRGDGKWRGESGLSVPFVHSIDNGTELSTHSVAKSVVVVVRWKVWVCEAPSWCSGHCILSRYSPWYCVCGCCLFCFLVKRFGHLARVRKHVCICAFAVL
jgi:hypothetical protein